MRSNPRTQEWADGAIQLIQRYLDESCVSRFHHIANGKPNYIWELGNAHPGVVKEYLGAHAKALKTLAENLTNSDIKQ